MANQTFGDDGLCNRYPDCFSRQYFTYENWLWALTMLFSIAIRLCNFQDGKALAMVLYADLIYHLPFSGAFVDARQEGDWLIKTRKLSRCVVVGFSKAYHRVVHCQ